MPPRRGRRRRQAPPSFGPGPKANQEPERDNEVDSKTRNERHWGGFPPRICGRAHRVESNPRPVARSPQVVGCVALREHFELFYRAAVLALQRSSIGSIDASQVPRSSKELALRPTCARLQGFAARTVFLVERRRAGKCWLGDLERGCRPGGLGGLFG